jgi:hypothetical protein
MDKRTSLQHTIPHYVTFADDENPLLGVFYTSRRADEDPDSPKPYCSIQVDADGSDDSKLIVLVNIGASATSYDQYQFSSSASGITDPDGNDASPTHTQVTTLGALIDELNDVSGLSAYRLHAISSLSIDSDDFIDLDKTRVGGPASVLKCLYMDVSEHDTLYYRIGIPEHSSGLGGSFLEIESLEASINVDSGTGTLKLEVDPDETSTSNMKTVVYRDNLVDDTLTTIIDRDDAYPVVQGPILITVSGTSLTQTDCRVSCNVRQAVI